MISEVKILRHSSLNLPILFDAAAKWYALEVSFQGISPLMVRADEIGSVAIAITTEAHSTMRTYVLDDAYGPVFISHHQHGPLADCGTPEVAGVGYLGLQTYVTPMSSVKEAFELASI
jgi:hypothetical protein